MYKIIFSTILTGTLMAVGPQLNEADAGRNWNRSHYGHRHYHRDWDRGRSHYNYNRHWNDWNRNQYRSYRYYGNRNYRGYQYGNRGYYRGYNNSPRFGFYYSF